jgi:hypothetical protein
MGIKFSPDYVSDKAEWRRRLLDGMSKAKVQPVELSDRFDASVPTVHRWMEGKSVPVPALRKMVIEYLQQHVDREPTVEEILGMVAEIHVEEPAAAEAIGLLMVAIEKLNKRCVSHSSSEDSEDAE